MDIAKLDKYVQPRKQSILTPYLEEIRYLLERGATQKSILAYLKNEEGVEVTQSYLSRFIKRYITTGDTTPKRKQIPKPVAEASVDMPAEEIAKEENPGEKIPAETKPLWTERGVLETLCQSDRITYSKGRTHERDVRFK